MPEPIESVEELPDDVRRMLIVVQESDYFCGWDWIRNFCHNGIGPDAHPRFYIARAEIGKQQHCALLALQTPAGQAGSVIQRPRTIRNSLSSLTSYQSTRYTVHLPADPEASISLARLLAMQVCEGQSPPSVLDLNLIETLSPGYQAFCAAMQAHGYRLQQYKYDDCLFENVEGLSFEEYLRHRPSQVRKTYMRKARQFEKQFQCRFELFDNSSNLSVAIRDYEAVLASSWKSDEPFPEFIRQLIQDAAAAGILRLGILYADNTPVAAQLWILSRGRATIYKLHYRETLAAKAVGAMLSLRMLEHAIDVDHAYEIDFGVGNEAHKRLWMSQSRPLNGVLAFAPRDRQAATVQFRYLCQAYWRKGRKKLSGLLKSR